ncbi:DUF6436 domain-containing protein [Alkalimonas amylolytica]|uniref:DUF6436 domain-containing protein n=1 Tax=Alkalimonas amylolytica TaxID=152573 RepID=A0A1H4E341_ALKAM|nr:DUF6436 domain-containing protein [Alkalimonas amylolytica]SEA79199.1 hypothetical protein SAMN04488051_106181 [Alkalimonas amylolytica]
MKPLCASVLLAIWLLLSGALLWQDQRSLVGPFDQHQHWQTAPLHGSELTSLIPGDNSNAWLLVHVEDPDCRCHRQHQEHRQELQQTFANIPQYTVSVKQLRQQGLLLPAAPMAILLQQGALVYAGPYSAGAACGNSDGWIESLVRGELKLAGSWLNGESSSCRCLQAG